MSERNLNLKSREALLHIRNLIMHSGRFPSVRELMETMGYKSPRSAMLLLMELEENGFLQKKEDGSYRLLKDLESSSHVRTVNIPLVGTVTCGLPILAVENIEAMIPVSVTLAKPGSKYFLLTARGDSMNKAGINDGDLILVRQQSVADDGQKVVALINDEATVKEIQRAGNVIKLLPRSTNTKHQPIIVTEDFHIQGVVVETIPKE
jgi:repressor LexA